MFIHRLYKFRVFIYTLIGIIFLAGAYVFYDIPKESAPEINVPFFSITTIYPGADWKTIKDQITQKIEKEIKWISKISQIQSVSADNVSIVTVEFERNKPLYECWNDLKSAVDKTLNDLPEDAENPIISQINITNIPVYIFSLKGDYLPSVLYDKIRYLKDEIENIPWVDEVKIIWEYTPQIEIWFDLQKLDQHNLKFSQVVGLLSNYLFSVPADKKKISQSLYTIDVSTYSDKDIQKLLEDLRQFPIISKNGRNIRLQDIADIRLSPPFFKKLSYVDGKPAVTFQIFKVPWYDIYTLVKDVRKYLETQKGYFKSQWLEFKQIYSDEENINRIFLTFINNFWQTTLIILGVLFLFLWFRQAVGVFLAFPLVYLLVFIYIYMIGFSFNNVVSFSLILTLWIMVDNLIVIVEGFTAGLERLRKIWRSSEENLKKAEEIGDLNHRQSEDKITDNFEGITGNEEMGVVDGVSLKLQALQYSISTYRKPILAWNLTTISMFFPLNFLLTWRVGEFLKYMPVVVDWTLIFSMIVALVILPVILMVVYKERKSEEGLKKFWRSFGENLKKVWRNKSQTIQNYITDNWWYQRMGIQMIPDDEWGSEKKSDKDSNLLLSKFYPLLSKLHLLWYTTFFAALRRPKLTILAFVLMFVFSFVLFKKFVPFDFLPPTDKNNIYVNIKYDETVSLNENTKYSYEIYYLIKDFFERNYPWVVNSIAVNIWDWTTNDVLLASVYRSSFSPNTVAFNVSLIDEDFRDVSALEMYPALDSYLKQKLTSYPIIQLDTFIWKNWPSAWKDFGLYIYLSWDTSFDKLALLTEKLMKEFKSNIPEAYGWSTSLEYDIWKLKIKYDMDAVLQYGINPVDLKAFMNAFQNSFDYKWEGVKIYSFNEFGKDPINLKAYVSFTSGNWLNLPIPGYKGIYLGQIVKDYFLQSKIRYYQSIDWRFVIKIEWFKKPNVALQQITDKIEKIMQNYPELKYSFGMDVKDMRDAVKDLAKAFVIGIMLMILVLVFYFNSYKYVFVIFASLPLLFIGSFLFLLVTWTPFSFPAQIWIFGLVGVWINNAILLVDKWLGIKDKKGLTVDQKLFEIVKQRFRPLFLTTLTTVLGLLTLAFKYELWASLAYTFMGGLVLWFFIILLFIPALLKIIDK